MTKARRSGQITQKGKDKWLVRVFVGRDRVSGKRQYDSEIVNGKLGTAKAVLNEKVAKCDKGQLVRNTKISLKVYLDDWVETIVKARVREATYNSYKYHLDHYLSIEVLETQLTKLRTLAIQKFVNELSSKYSSRTVQYVHTLLKNALKKAVQMRLLVENPCEFVELPKSQKKEVSVFTREQAQKFLTATKVSKHGLIFEFGLLTGARPEEFLALKWSDLDVVRSTVSFRRTLIWRKGGGWYFDDQMKTAMSRRTIPLPLILLNKLKQHRISQAKYTLTMGSAYHRNELIFASDEGTPLHYGNLTKRYFRPILAEAGLGHFTLYSLRHSCATLLLADGVNIKVIQERLGHADITLTLSTYSHVLEGMQEHASERIGDLLYAQNVG
jgi:integrase